MNSLGISDIVKRCEDNKCQLCLIYQSRLAPPRRKAAYKDGVRNVKPKLEKNTEAVTISKKAFSIALAQSGLSFAAAHDFCMALETATASEDNPVVFAKNLQEIATEHNKLFDDCTPRTPINLGVGEGASIIITDLTSFVKKVLIENDRCADEVALCRLSADHGGNSLKVSASFLFTGDPILDPPSRRQCQNGKAEV